MHRFVLLAAILGSCSAFHHLPLPPHARARRAAASVGAAPKTAMRLMPTPVDASAVPTSSVLVSLDGLDLLTNAWVFAGLVAFLLGINVVAGITQPDLNTKLDEELAVLMGIEPKTTVPVTESQEGGESAVEEEA